MSQVEGPGFFGKLPSRGDFVSRRLSGDFVSRWDAWLQDALAASQASLGNQWLDIYLTSPIWRFALSADVCGDRAYAGVVVPSVDKVGRYFPLAAVLACNGESFMLEVAARLEDWYSSVAELLLETLADIPLDLEEFDARLARLTPTQALARADTRFGWQLSSADAAVRWHCAVPAGSAVSESIRPLLSELLANEVGPHGLWWTEGSERVEPCVLIASELPSAEAFIGMLDGRWSEHGWTSGTVEHSALWSAEPAALELRSAGVTDAGKTRQINEDSFACRDDLGVWIVADGLGGHQAGDTASRMVTSIIGELRESELAQRHEQLAQALRVVNGCLRALAEHDPEIALTGSTVAALLVERSSLACVWVGDSRVYRLRDGQLEQLTRDHSEAEEGIADTHVITRAVGGDEELQLEIVRSDVRADDRYLLCTDGLYGELTADDIARALLLDSPEQACARLKEIVLTHEARDNLTAVVVYSALASNV